MCEVVMHILVVFSLNIVKMTQYKNSMCEVVMQILVLFSLNIVKMLL